MKRLFFIVGGLIAALTVIMVSAGLWIIDEHKKKLNRLKTEKGRQTRIDNLKKTNEIDPELSKQIDKEVDEILNEENEPEI